MGRKIFHIGEYVEELIFQDNRFALIMSQGKREAHWINPKDAERWWKEHFPQHSWRMVLKEIAAFQKKKAG